MCPASQWPASLAESDILEPRTTCPGPRDFNAHMFGKCCDAESGVMGSVQYDAHPNLEGRLNVHRWMDDSSPVAIEGQERLPGNDVDDQSSL
jgi:hypothetical protein